MTAEQLAAYFGRKIAKPIPFDVCVETPHGRVFWVYELEVAAVDEEILHMTVLAKGMRADEGRWMSRSNIPRGDIEIPLRDGDCVSELLGMAVAVCGVAEKIDRLPTSDGLRRCYREYKDRAEERRNLPGPRR